MPRIKKVETSDDTKKTTNKKVDNLSKAIKSFDNYISLDFSQITTALIKDIKENEDSRNDKLMLVLDFVKKVEITCRGYYMNGNQFALPALNLHISRMNDILAVYEFLYAQTYNNDIKKIILNNILFVIQDMISPRKYEVLNSFGKTYEQFILDFRFSTELINKSNYYANQLNNINFYM